MKFVIVKLSVEFGSISYIIELTQRVFKMKKRVSK